MKQIIQSVTLFATSVLLFGHVAFAQQRYDRNNTLSDSTIEASIQSLKLRLGLNDKQCMQLKALHVKFRMDKQTMKIRQKPKNIEESKRKFKEITNYQDKELKRILTDKQYNLLKQDQQKKTEEVQKKVKEFNKNAEERMKKKKKK